MFAFDDGSIVGVMIFAIPIVAIAGGITAGIVKTISRHRLIELAQRERIAAIERGIDPATLPPMPTILSDDDEAPTYMTFRQATIHRSRGLLVGGMITLAVGLGLSVMLYFLAHDGSENTNAWAIGMIPTFIGLALLLASFLYSRFAASDSDGPAKH
jgi:hypothetical protein